MEIVLRNENTIKWEKLSSFLIRKRQTMVDSTSFYSLLVCKIVPLFLCSFPLFVSHGNLLLGVEANPSSKAKVLERQHEVTLPLEYMNDCGVYAVKLGLGTPAKTQTLVLTSGLDISWAQCHPCSKCYKQTEPMFDPSKSSSYENVPCSPSCSNGCTNTTCTYWYQNGNNSTVDGDLSTEVLSLTKEEAVPGFVFGCGRTNDVKLLCGAAGSFGLGTGPQSFLSVTADIFNQTFSYYLPSRNATGFLSLGVKAYATSKSPQFVPFSKLGPFSGTLGSTNYGLDVVGISVGGRSLPLEISTSKPLACLLEIGNRVTRFPRDIYAALRDEFRKNMSSYPIVQNLSSVLDTCFDLLGKPPVVPIIEFTFDNGVSLPFNSSQILYPLNSSVSCLGFSTVDNSSTVAFLGSFQQTNLEIIYDNPNKRIGFVREGFNKKESSNSSFVVNRAPATRLPAPAVALTFTLAVLLILY